MAPDQEGVVVPYAAYHAFCDAADLARGRSVSARVPVVVNDDRLHPVVGALQLDSLEQQRFVFKFSRNQFARLAQVTLTPPEPYKVGQPLGVRDPNCERPLDASVLSPPYATLVGSIALDALCDPRFYLAGSLEVDLASEPITLDDQFNARAARTFVQAIAGMASHKHDADYS